MADKTALTREDFARISNVSRETLEDYSRWHTLLVKWNARINLVAPATLQAFWGRHALDSWQICPHLPNEARIFLDLGSGAGFPGLAIAIYLKHQNLNTADEDGAACVHLVESAGKKASFLKTVVRELGLPARVHAARVEDIDPMGADILTARAFAPLPRLFGYAAPHLHAGSMLILPKGEKAQSEVKSARDTWTFTLETAKSVTHDDASLLQITNLVPKN